ncbi:hypothetical protein DPMN_052561 [Dreissena polymorpha]|uniref:Uncharacterized protein n=1 Tax=Dreissena polymorpha TaxID=45954 RepID=A0A9D4CKN1_DREPO|nr:hypothetical protein DPMN_052561 [Dreissena polymorpha]
MFSLYTYRENCPTPGGHVFPPIVTIFEIVQDIYKISIDTKHQRAKNVTSRVKMNPPPSSALSNDSSCLPIQTIFELNRHIQKTHVLNKFHEDWTKNVTSRVFTCFNYMYIHIEKTAPPPWLFFSPIWTIFELVRDINETNVFTKFHDAWAKIVTSRVFTRNTAPPPGGHVFQGSGTIF